MQCRDKIDNVCSVQYLPCVNSDQLSQENTGSFPLFSEQTADVIAYGIWHRNCWYFGQDSMVFSVVAGSKHPINHTPTIWTRGSSICNTKEYTINTPEKHRLLGITILSGLEGVSKGGSKMESLRKDKPSFRSLIAVSIRDLLHKGLFLQPSCPQL